MEEKMNVQEYFEKLLLKLEDHVKEGVQIDSDKKEQFFRTILSQLKKLMDDVSRVPRLQRTLSSLVDYVRLQSGKAIERDAMYLQNPVVESVRTYTEVDSQELEAYTVVSMTNAIRTEMKTYIEEKESSNGRPNSYLNSFADEMREQARYAIRQAEELLGENEIDKIKSSFRKLEREIDAFIIEVGRSQMSLQERISDTCIEFQNMVEERVKFEQQREEVEEKNEQEQESTESQQPSILDFFEEGTQVEQSSESILEQFIDNPEVGEKERAEAEAREREQRDAKRREEEEKRARFLEAMVKLREEAEAKLEEDLRIIREKREREEAEAKAREEAEARAREEAEARAREEAETRAREEAEARAREEAEAKAREEAERIRQEQIAKQKRMMKSFIDSIQNVKARKNLELQRGIAFRREAGKSGIEYDSPIVECANLLRNIEYNRDSASFETMQMVTQSISRLDFIDATKVLDVEENEFKRAMMEKIMDVRIRKEIGKLEQQITSSDARKITFFDRVFGKSKEIKKQQELVRSEATKKINDLRRIYSNLMSNGLSHECRYSAREILAEVELLEANGELSQEDIAMLQRCKQGLSVFNISRAGVDKRKAERSNEELGEYDVETFIRQSEKMIGPGLNMGRKETVVESTLRSVARTIQLAERAEIQQERETPEMRLDEI